MTVIAWDGRTLAADKRGVAAGYGFTVTKLFRTELGLVGVDGYFDSCLELVEWIRSGANPSEHPDSQKDEKRYSYAVLITPDKKILRYECGPLPIKVEEKFYACGSGRDYALAAMYMGATAEKAVAVASHFDTECGNGIDTLEFEG